MNRCQFDPNTLVVKAYDKAMCRLTVRTIKPFRLKEVYLQLMLHLNEDFDDDLLIDALRLLKREWFDAIKSEKNNYWLDINLYDECYH